jgi:hypothetical protein
VAGPKKKRVDDSKNAADNAVKKTPDLNFSKIIIISK